MNILFENDNYIVVYKAATESTVPDNTGDTSVQETLETKLEHPIHAITRIDKVVSGLCLFAKNEKEAARLSESLRSRKIKKTYLAIVEGIIEKDSDRLEHLLKKKGNKTYVAEDGKKSVLSYTVLERLDNYTVIEAYLITGRFHQIRAQLAAIGHAVKGDVKYGARRKNKDRSIHLHSWKLGLDDERIIAALPKDSLWSIVDKIVR